MCLSYSPQRPQPRARQVVDSLLCVRRRSGCRGRTRSRLWSQGTTRGTQSVLAVADTVKGKGLEAESEGLGGFQRSAEGMLMDGEGRGSP